MGSLLERILNFGNRKTAQKKEKFYQSFVRDILESDLMRCTTQEQSSEAQLATEFCFHAPNKVYFKDLNPEKCPSFFNEHVYQGVERMHNELWYVDVYKSTIASQKCRVVLLKKKNSQALFFVFRLLTTEEKKQILDFFKSEIFQTDAIQFSKENVIDSAGNSMQLIDDYYYALNFYGNNW